LALATGSPPEQLRTVLFHDTPSLEGFWAVMIAASTVLIHQHHLLDVATGWLLALVCVKSIFDRIAIPDHPDINTYNP
jgi:hypothetical protein